MRTSIWLALACLSAMLFALVSVSAEGEWEEAEMAQTSIGAAKIRAAKLGLSLDDYLLKNQTEKWCVGCKEWHSRDRFGGDVSRTDGLASQCLRWRKGHYDRTYVRTGRKSQAGIYKRPTRDGDKKQARSRVNHEVDVGRIPDPNALPCADCGHAWIDGERRHEYDHHLGYSAAHQLSVQAVCVRCHKAREAQRRAAANALPPGARLSLEQLRTIRAQLLDRSTRQVAEAMSLDTETVRRIKVGESYRSVA